MCATRHGRLRRFLAALAIAAVACLALSPVGAAQAAGQARQSAMWGQAGLAASGRLPGPAPQPGEWWFSKWDIRQEVWPLSQGAGVTVAVLDSGVQASVSDLRGAVVPGTVIGGSGNGEQDTDTAGRGHGTQMASLIAGRGGTGIAGIAPQAKILPVVIPGEGGPGQLDFKNDNGKTESEMTAGINYAVSHGAQVINISAAGVSPLADLVPCNDDNFLEQAIANAIRHNVVVVAASGNVSEDSIFPVLPAACPGVLTVGGVDQDGKYDPGASAGPYVDVAAPFDQESQGLDGKLYQISGTSGATALVSGEVALMKSRYPDMPWDEVVARVTSQVVFPPGGPSPNAGEGNGIPDIFRALDASHYQDDVADPVGASFLYNQLIQVENDKENAAGSASHPVAGAELLLGGILMAGGIVLAAVLLARRRRTTGAVPSGLAALAGHGTQPGYGPRAPWPPAYGPPATVPGYGQPATGPAYGQPGAGPAYGPPATAPGYGPPAAGPGYGPLGAGPGYSPPPGAAPGGYHGAPPAGPGYPWPAAAQPGYGQLGPAQSGYGPASPPPYHSRSAARRRSATSRGRSAVVGTVCAALAVVAGGVLTFTGYEGTQGPSVSQQALGSSACVTANTPGGGGTRLKFTRPPAVCGLPPDTIPAELQWVNSEASAIEQSRIELDLVGMRGNHVASRTVGVYATPAGLQNTYRQIYFVGYTGTFNPKLTVEFLMASDSGAQSVPAGPHGGSAQCYTYFTMTHCAWATTTTVGDFWFLDGQISHETTQIALHINTNFAMIRDVLEVGG